MALGHRAGDPPDERFNMAVMGLRLAGRSNAVSKLHGAVSREMFSDLWPDVPEDEVPIQSVTNGVHAPTWVSPEMADVLARHVLPEWDEAGPERWARILDARDDELWRARAVGRERLVAFIRRRLRESLAGRGRRRCPTWRGATRCSTRRRSPSASPAASPPTSGRRCCCRSPSGCRRCCSTPSGRCSSSSPARPTPPTSTARR